jgi:hypothetical protein
VQRTTFFLNFVSAICVPFCPLYSVASSHIHTTKWSGHYFTKFWFCVLRDFICALSLYGSTYDDILIICFARMYQVAAKIAKVHYLFSAALGGLVVFVLAIGPQAQGFKPGRGYGLLRAT